MIFLLLTCVIRDARPPADETRGNVHLRHRHCPEAAKEKQNTRNQRPTCPVYMIAADARSVWEGSPHTTKGSIARTLTCRSALQSRIESHGHKSASIAAPGDILFLSPKNQICVFPQAGLLTRLHRLRPFSAEMPMVMASARPHSSGPVGDLHSVPYSPPRLHVVDAQAYGHLWIPVYSVVRSV